MMKLFTKVPKLPVVWLLVFLLCAMAVGCGDSSSITNSVDLEITNVDMKTGIVTGTVAVRNSDPVPPILPGTLDPAFGTGGIATISFNHDIDVKTVVNQSTERILVLVTITDPTIGLRGLFIIPFKNDGTYDTAFNDGNDMAIVNPDVHITAVDMAVQADGKIVVLGDVGENKFLVGRFTSDGATDTSFGYDGVMVIVDDNVSLSSAALAIQEDQKIVAAATGQFVSGDSTTKIFTAYRLTTNGMPDTNFDVGIGITDENIVATDMLIQPDGKIVIVGFSETEPDYGYVLARFLENGTVDTSFTIGVEVDGLRPWIKLYGKTLALQADGKILMCGKSINTEEDAKSSLFLARQNADGATDDPFGVPPGESGGLGAVAFFYDGRSSTGVRVVVQEDQKIISLGNGTSKDTGLPVAFAVRTDEYGVMDAFFGEKGEWYVLSSALNEVEAADMILLDDVMAVIAAKGTSTGGEQGGTIVLSKFHTRGLQSLTVKYNDETPVNARVSNDGSWTASLGNIGEGSITARAVYTMEASNETISASKTWQTIFEE